MDKLTDQGVIATLDRPARRAALMLHGLPAQAQQQVLARLDSAAQQRLKHLLDELIELGIPARASAMATEADPPAAPPTAAERVARLDAQVVHAALQRLPKVLAGKLLRGRDWPWREALALHPDPALRHLLAPEGAVVPMGPAAFEGLCEVFCEAVVQEPQASPATGKIWQRVMSWIR